MRLQTIVKRVDLGRNGAKVTLASGDVLEADDVVLAVPPSVWNKIGIEPPLPPQLAPQMGINVKFLMARAAGSSGCATGSRPTCSATARSTGLWHQTDGQKGPGASMCAFSGGHRRRHLPRMARRPSARRATWRDLGKVYPSLRRQPAQDALHGLAVGRLGARRRTRSPRRAR